MLIGRLLERPPALALWQDPAPIRAELLSIERLEAQARALAATQALAPVRVRGHPLAGRLADNAAFLLRANRAIAEAADDRHPMTPAAEWLVDNYHLVDMQIREIGIDLPRGYYAELPKLRDGPFAGLPRVFAIAWSVVAHTDSHFEPETLFRYLGAYQQAEPLTIGELWAVPITLRIVLIENLRRLAEGMVANAAARQDADRLADQLLSDAEDATDALSDMLARRAHAPLSAAFAVQFAHRLRTHSRRTEAALAWLDERLAARDTTTQVVVRDELLRQGAFNATIRNIINSLRSIAGMDWTDAFERACLVDGVLATSVSYRDMDFQTRNLYRDAIEALARGSAHSELDIARRAVALARDGASADRRARDAGYHLFAGGRAAFEAAIGFRPRLSARLARLCRGLGIAGYGTGVIAVAALFVALALSILARVGLDGGWLALLGVLAAIPASDAAVACVNRSAMWAFGATCLPGLELRDGIAADRRTLVVVPTLLTSPAAVAAMVARLEVHYLASQDGEVHFALLSDWTDSRTEHAAGDDALLDAARAGIARLNRLHGPAPGGARFLLLHRRRVWNDGESRWIGWERKRGKLHELNRLLRGAGDTSFLDDPPTLPAAVRYVVTVDSDTRLPLGAVRRLVGKMAHPLNAPRLDPASGRVVEGYALLQPRVTPSLPIGRDSSLFQRVFSSLDGIDPYAGAVSDVYQDLFGEGSYAGKGIYDVDAFEAALAGRVPESMLLSHDLFEGVFARAGLASDVEVVEEFPTGYAVAALRQYRWARGDWQLLPWLLPWRRPPGGGGRRPPGGGGRRPPGGGGRRPPGGGGAMPAIGRWKMLDNLRRTLSAPAAMLALLVGWRLAFDAALVWTGLVLATILLPAALPVIGSVLVRRRWITWRSYLGGLRDSLRQAGAFAGLTVVFLAHQAGLMSEAIGRTLVRVFVTHRHRLQWLTAAQAAEGPELDLAGWYRRMAAGPVFGVVAFAIAVASQPRVWWIALPLAAVWIASPAIARWASQCLPASRRSRLSPDDLRILRTTARRTWRFFETFVTPADNMLPPDNFQEDPAPVLAHRTSPTNLGLYLLSTVSAHDFGWVGLVDTIERLEATLATMARLSRHRGHFYNWYETTDLRALEPRYVSTVDSGNLAGHLIALASACREWREPAETAERSRAGADDARELAREMAAGAGGEADTEYWTSAAQRTIDSHRRDADPLASAGIDARLAALAETAHGMALAMEFGFLRNVERKLLSIGYLVAEGELDTNCYDLLASEARLASFVAIAKGDVPAREWFRLGRAVTPIADGAALVSWSGSMFEYLMPSLVMRAPAGSLLEQTNRLVVRRQIDFMAPRGIPWGVSESAYNVRDIEYTYQYSNFGIPGLGLKRGLEADVVVAPYASALAAMVDPRAAVRNFARLASVGALGRYGFYEALDYTPARVPERSAVAIVRAFMAHHQGMTITAIADAVLDGRMRSRFHAEPMIEATELLLQERAPRNVAVALPLPAGENPAAASQDGALHGAPPGGRRFSSAHAAAPATHLLSNGRYTVMLTAAGSGFSRWQDIAVTRWREDATLDDWGAYIYLRDSQSGQVWSAGLQPIGVEPDEYDVAFSEDRAEFARRDGTLTTLLEVLVSSEEDAEVRRVSIANAGSVAREIEITSFAELALAPQAADIAHPAFAKLFVETEYLAGTGAILATRRRRTPGEPEIWAAHLVVAEGEIEIETDRARFIGRGHGVRDPAAMTGGQKLSNAVGTVLDAAFAVRCRIAVAPGAMVRVAFWTMVAPSRAAAIGCIDKHRDVTAFDRASTLAWTQAQVELRHLGIRPGEADLFQRLAGHLLFAGPGLRPPSGEIRQGSGAQSALWGLGISGDLPILLLRLSDVADLDLSGQLLLAHEYFGLKRFAVDLVILNEHAASYSQDLQGALEALVRSRSRSAVGRTGATGAVFLLRADRMSAPARALLLSVARVVLAGDGGRLSEQLDRAGGMAGAGIHPPAAQHLSGSGSAAPPVPTLEFANGLGGFAENGTEYVVALGPGQVTPAPWINVIANPGFGFQVAAEGSGYSWAANSRENQLTPWSNDPVGNRPGEVFYLADEENSDLWCATAAPRRDPAATYVARHGFGYSRFDRIAHGIASSLLQYVPPADPIKISRLQLHNVSGRARSISVCAYVEWVLGAARGATAAFVETEIDAETGAIFARNPWNAEFGERVAFLDLNGRQTGWTGDRREFIGRNGTLDRPAALAGGRALSNRTGAGLDPCGALRTVIQLPPDGRAEIVCFLGQATTAAHAQRLIRQYRTTDLDAVLAKVRCQWNDTLGAAQVKTPDRGMDILLNGWLLYQTLACRVWARAGFYQASGAYGFRDQLQDGMALVASRPDVVRAHLLRAAARQFLEGDVQHWWLPQSGAGVRTRISDDCAWLAYVVAQYVDATGDAPVLDETIPFLAAQPLAPDEHDRFFLPATADQAASLFEHCARALDHSLAVGGHGLPLMGTGDWNDGMSRVGEGGQGESVWLGWFLHAALLGFAPLAEARHDTARAARWREAAAALQAALAQAWDGEWYLRAYFDDGTPMGSHADAECRIDSIAQSWAVLSGAAPGDRPARAMASVERELVRLADGLVLVLTPPFDKTSSDPGYIKGYPPGIRENGGQYTHAALWSVMALAKLGEGDKAAALFALLNPIHHALRPSDVARYGLEPYVVAADIYSRPPHVGRGGWSWYTGSAGWMQRAGIESLLGLRIRGGVLQIDPCIPKAWPGFEATIAWRTARYRVVIENPSRVSRGVCAIRLDGASLASRTALALSDDGATHTVEVRLG